MELKSVLVAVLAVGGLAYAAGRYLQPAEVQIKYEERIKEVLVENRNVRTVVREVTNPDGTTVKETTIEDKSVVEKERESKIDSSKVVINLKPQWKAQVLLGLDSGPLQPLQGASIERRVIGPVFAGVWANTDKKFGLSVSMEF